MFFNGFTLLLMMIAFTVGVGMGMRAEINHNRRRAQAWVDGESLESHLAKDGWRL
jgi:hypothetical protein